MGTKEKSEEWKKKKILKFKNLKNELKKNPNEKKILKLYFIYIKRKRKKRKLIKYNRKWRWKRKWRWIKVKSYRHIRKKK